MSESKKTILIIDDQKTSVTALSMVLGAEYKIYAVGNGREAVSVAENCMPDVILLDIKMDDMDGYEVIAALKKSALIKDIPVIFITGLTDEDSEEKGLALGAADYITKPLSPSIVKLRVRHQINMREQMQTIQQQMEEIKTLEFANVKNMLDSTPYTCHLWNREMQMLDCNEASLALFKVDSREELKERFAEFSPEHQPDGTLSIIYAENALERTFREGKSVFNYTHLTKDGEPIPCEVTLVRISLQSDDYVVVYIKDLREYNAMVARLEEALDEAKAANTAKSQFLSNMSHEIRTPMNAITGMGELLMHEELNERQTGYVNDIVVSAKSLLGIINDILDLSKIESGKLELSPIDYDFTAFLNSIESMFIHITQQKGLDFTLEHSGNLPDVLFGDDLRLRQTLTNILGNAVKFTEKGSVQLKVIESDNSLTFKIKDTGIGIRKEALPNIFSAFEQVDKLRNRNIVGTGLGLAISKSFVEMMGGSITIESEYGVGTTFTIIIPIVIGDKDKIDNTTAVDKHEPIYAPLANVLVVDDNIFNLNVSEGLLGLMGIEAEMAESGYDAIELIGHKDYDVVFMDHMMPEMDGIETTLFIRGMGVKYKTLPIIALTANALSGAKEMFLSNGFNDFISKPIKTQELIRVLKDWIPSEKIQERTDDGNSGEPEHSAMEDELFRKSIVTFVKGNKDTMENLIDAIDLKDMKTAHRMAHTLKSSAGYLKLTKLQDAAASLEDSLHGKPPRYTSAQLDVLSKELESALHKYDYVLSESHSDNNEIEQIDKSELTSLLAELKPLLEKGNFDAVNYVNRLKGSEETKKLAELVDDFDFEGALRELSIINS